MEFTWVLERTKNISPLLKLRQDLSSAVPCSGVNDGNVRVGRDLGHPLDSVDVAFGKVAEQDTGSSCH